MKKLLLPALFFLTAFGGKAQTPKNYSSADILQQIKKLEVFGSVLYIAAHPDDENTRLLGYLANERKFRTGYLSLTRGDGGQNLIGDEQGIELGLIRTQELLAARRIDGAEQFFSRAYDFGFSKSPEEALKIWGHDKILSDVVWVIRKFQPDVIITRFPTTGEGGHGHHTASAILAGEAFDAAADPTKFPEQFKYGVKPWQAKRLFWNTFNFGGNNTTNENQLKIDVGMYNPILGKSYGEIAAASRSQHKSQGFGVPAQRGESFEYFALIKGDKAQKDIMDGIDITSKRIGNENFSDFINELAGKHSIFDSNGLLNMLVRSVAFFKDLPDSYWKQQKLKEINDLVLAASGIFLEAGNSSPYAVAGDSLRINFTINNRLGVDAKNFDIEFAGKHFPVKAEGKNRNEVNTFAVLIPKDAPLSQPYWLREGMPNGSFSVSDQELIGKPWNYDLKVIFSFETGGQRFFAEQPVIYKSTDPVKGEIYQEVTLVPPVTLHIEPELNVVTLNDGADHFIDKKYRLFTDGNRLADDNEDHGQLKDLKAGAQFNTRMLFDLAAKPGSSFLDVLPVTTKDGKVFNDMREIKYDHIPAIRYFKPVQQKVLVADIKIKGKNIGYIPGAGDKVPQALMQMGYHVTMLAENDITAANLKQFDAVVTGVRAYNTSLWLTNAATVLNNYVKEGGVFLVQYNTNNNAGPLRQKIGPYPFTLGRNRITDETAAVKFLLPNDPSLNYPNKITQKDFEGWIQERSVYHAENIDSNYRRVLSMKDPGETENDGSLIIADHGKGRFIYTGLVFFRELPAGVPGAYRLLANLLAAPQGVKK